MHEGMVFRTASTSACKYGGAGSELVQCFLTMVFFHNALVWFSSANSYAYDHPMTMPCASVSLFKLQLFQPVQHDEAKTGLQFAVQREALVLACACYFPYCNDRNRIWTKE